jgi:hypothetical protein
LKHDILRSHFFNFPTIPAENGLKRALYQEWSDAGRDVTVFTVPELIMVNVSELFEWKLSFLVVGYVMPTNQKPCPNGQTGKHTFNSVKQKNKF